MNIINLSNEPHYINLLAQWHHQEWAHFNPKCSLNNRIKKMQAYLSNDLIPSTYIYKYMNDLAGSASIIKNDMNTKPELSPWLTSVYVKPMHRGKGIGTSLVHHITEIAKISKISDLYLFTPNNEMFYASLGWSTISIETYHGIDVAVMVKSLEG